MTELLTCPTCSATDLDPLNDVCQHRYALCYGCCLTGEHNWYTPPLLVEDRFFEGGAA